MTEDVADAILDWIDEDDEPRELGAEVELCLGEELNTHIITTSTAVANPRMAFRSS